jgi:MFS family permease
VNRELGRIILAQVFLHACMAGTRLAAPLLALREGYSPLAVGILLALFALMQVFLALPSGRYADRHGLKRPVGFAVMAAVFGAGAAVAFPVFPVLCLAALLTGGATGSAVIAIQRHVGRAASGGLQLRQVFSWLSIGPAISNFVGPFSAGLLIDHVGAVPGDLSGYRAAFLLMAVLPLLSWWLLRHVPELNDTVAPAEGPRPSTLDLLREASFRRLMGVNWLLSSCWDVHTFVVPLLGHERGLPASVIGTILGAFAIAAAAVRMLLPLLASRVREWAVLVGAMLVTALLFSLYPLTNSALSMGVCSVLLGVTLGMVQPMVMSLLHQITPEARHGEALGLRMMAINASSVAMPVLFGTAGVVIGVAGIFWTVGAAVGLGARSAWHLRSGKAAAH